MIWKISPDGHWRRRVTFIIFLVYGHESFQHTHTHKKVEAATERKTFTAVRVSKWEGGAGEPEMPA